MSTSSHPHGTDPALYRGQATWGIAAILVGILAATLTLTGARPEPATWMFALGSLLVTIGVVGLVVRRRRGLGR